MKKSIVGLTLAAFILLSGAQAGEKKTSDKNKAAPAEPAKVSASTGVVGAGKACCGGNEVGSSARKVCAEKAACCANEKAVRKTAGPEAKGAAILAGR